MAVVYGVWWYGLAQFDDDYCITSVEIPSGEPSVTGPEWEPPLTYRCDFGAAGVVTVNEPRPILWTGAMSGVGLLLVSSIWWKLARSSSATPEYEGEHRP
ncbi:hypothetical protein [Actinospongicola halichondriae]|uniref:hypothetical protein n=1 Tax=Actinospongicola halichondriae TaxID=3236844 RepID=UPI003D48A1E0